MPLHAMELDRLFDVIIAGAGPAGCVLAARLSEESSKQVLLIEAGPDAVVPGLEDPDLLDPFAPVASNKSAFHWPGLAAETGTDRGDGAGRAVQPFLQGFGVGGASNINGMGVDRGQPGDYEEWRHLGVDGWSWADVLPYFKKVERDLDFSGLTPAMHGESGPIPVRRLPKSQWAPFAAAMADALERRGFSYIADYTADFREGFGSAPTNSLPNRRVSAAMGYLTEEVRRRPNLTVLAGTRVDRVSLVNACATGVWVERAGVRTQLRGRQIIAACGAIQSPLLLMRSGIGPRAQLASHDLALVRDAPGVGANLHNHPYIMLATYLPKIALQAPDSPSFLQNWLRYSSKHPDCIELDMHLMTFNRCDWHALGDRVGAVVVSALKYYSCGSVELAGPDPEASPKIRFNLLADQRDMERLVQGLRFALELLIDPSVARMHRELFVADEVLVSSLSRRSVLNRLRAGAIAAILDRGWALRRFLADWCIDAERLLSDERARREFVLKNARLQYHVCGTCRMGRAEDLGAVVDSEGRVHGVGALRVVDASIFPSLPRGYTHFIVLMAAEKIADVIRCEWQREIKAKVPLAGAA